MSANSNKQPMYTLSVDRITLLVYAETPEELLPAAKIHAQKIYHERVDHAMLNDCKTTIEVWLEGDDAPRRYAIVKLQPAPDPPLVDTELLQESEIRKRLDEHFLLLVLVDCLLFSNEAEDESGFARDLQLFMMHTEDIRNAVQDRLNAGDGHGWDDFIDRAFTDNYEARWRSDYRSNPDGS